MNPRLILLKHYQESGNFIDIENLTKIEGCNSHHFNFQDTPPLAELHGISLDQAKALIDNYGKEMVFDSELEKQVLAYFSVKLKIKKIEENRNSSE